MREGLIIRGVEGGLSEFYGVFSSKIVLVVKFEKFSKLSLID